MVTQLNDVKKMNRTRQSPTKDMCRICMLRSSGTKEVRQELTPKICRMVKTCTQLNVTINDSLPQLICSTCFKQLTDAYNFVQLAKKSHNALKKYSKKPKNDTNNDIFDKVDIKEEKEPFQEERLGTVNEYKPVKIKIENTFEFPEILQAVGLIKKASSITSDNRSRFKCNECGANFLWLEPYKRHLSNEHGVFTFECRICGDKFQSRVKLQKHKQDVHSGRNPYRCMECKMQFNSLDNLTIHIRKKHIGKVPFTCKQCKEGFETKEKLNEHAETHKKSYSLKNKERTHNCENCDKKFKKNSDLVRHVRVHTGEKPFVCKICNLGFQQAHNLTKHMVTHSKEKAFICDICNKQFGRNDSMVRHMFVHSLEKPHICTICKKTFARNGQLEIHMKNHHPS